MGSKNWLKTIGPGILFASTAIGVSHLVQSTRAGANFGFELVGLILITNILKYPFFEFGSRYANITGTSIIDGYQKMGKWMLWLYALVTLFSMFFVCSAVGFVTSGFLDNVFGFSLKFGSLFTPIALFLGCTFILFFGGFATLDKLIKCLALVLLITTLLAFVMVLGSGAKGNLQMEVNPWTLENVPFLIALMGWMPTAVDLSAWNSLWTLERIEESGYKPSLRETLWDFNFGYAISALLSICFVGLGANLMFGTNQKMPQGSAAFAGKVVEMYTHSIGHWSYWIIGISACSIMLGTAIAVFDGYSRSIKRITELIYFQRNKVINSSKTYKISLLVLSIGAFLIVLRYYNKPSGFTQLVDLATTISFLIAPLIAMVNYRLVLGKDIPELLRPKKWLRVLSVLGIVFLSAFSVVYLWYLFF